MGPNAEVWVHAKCAEEMQKLAPKDRAKIEACMNKMYCQLEKPEQIPFEKLNRNEGRQRIGLKDCRLQAFKHYQGRVYGVEGSVNGRRAFFAASSAVKKTDKVDVKELARAASRLGDVATAIAGASI